MSYSATCDDKPATEQERREIENILRSIRIVRSHGGWGQVTVELKAGDLVSIETSYTEKPDRPR